MTEMPRPSPSAHPECADTNFSNWKWQIANSVTYADLLDFAASKRPLLDWLPHEWPASIPLDPALLAVDAKYPVYFTPYWLRLAAAHKEAALQAMPDARELTARIETDRDDPFSEVSAPPVPGLVRRFKDRVLIVAARECAMRCRHCTRKNLLAEHIPADKSLLAAQKDYIAAHPEIREVLISGGDPLMLDDDALLGIVNTFTALPQLDAVRIGTRVPCTLPMRVTPALAKALGQSRRVWINTQFNHECEITPEAAEAAALLVDSGIPLSCQSVLLAGINDSADALVALFCKLQRNRIRPYYLFTGDPVNGTAHFRVSVARAAALEDEVASRIGGLALPRFVSDIPGARRKVPVTFVSHE